MSQDDLFVDIVIVTIGVEIVVVDIVVVVVGVVAPRVRSPLSPT